MLTFLEPVILERHRSYGTIPVRSYLSHHSLRWRRIL